MQRVWKDRKPSFSIGFQAFLDRSRHIEIHTPDSRRIWSAAWLERWVSEMPVAGRRVCAEGELVYIALPSGQVETPFVVAARSEGTRSGRVRAIEFPMRRTPCDTLGATGK